MLEIFVCYKFSYVISYVYMLEIFQRGTSATLENNKYKKKKKNPSHNYMAQKHGHPSPETRKKRKWKRSILRIPNVVKFDSDCSCNDRGSLERKEEEPAQ